MPFECWIVRLLNDLDIDGRRTFFTLFDGEGYAIALVQGLETVCNDAGKMNEYVRSVFLFDETITFFLVEPFYRSICHSDVLLSK